MAVQSDSDKADKRYIIELMQKRKTLFNQYSQLEKKRSGIFKSKTKRDINASKDMLNNIIAIDNKIINELDRLFEHKQFEQLSMGVDMVDYELQLNKKRERIIELEREQQNLVSKLSDLEAEVSRNVFWKYLFIFLAIVLTAFLGYIILAKKS